MILFGHKRNMQDEKNECQNVSSSQFFRMFRMASGLSAAAISRKSRRNNTTLLRFERCWKSLSCRVAAALSLLEVYWLHQLSEPGWLVGASSEDDFWRWCGNEVWQMKFASFGNRISLILWCTLSSQNSWNMNTSNNGPPFMNSLWFHQAWLAGKNPRSLTGGWCR